MKWSFWSDEERWFLPRTLGLGYSLNVKYLAKRLGWIQGNRPRVSAEPGSGEQRPESREDRLRRQADESRYEGRS